MTLTDLPRAAFRTLAQMTALAVLVGILSLSPHRAAAQDGDPAIEGVITRQIEAFLSEDVERAFTFASPMIQQMFVTPQRFGQMVRQGYPMVWRPSEVTMGELRVERGRPVQSVILRDAAGALFIADYEMIQIDGAWRINGVRIRRAPDAGA
ncbi:MAG: DUF4864 domain-containing protein [Pseudomonadota bacterium]